MLHHRHHRPYAESHAPIVKGVSNHLKRGAVTSTKRTLRCGRPSRCALLSFSLKYNSSATISVVKMKSAEEDHHGTRG